MSCLCNSLLPVQHSVNYFSDTSFTLFTLLWFIAKTRQEINLKWKKNFEKIFWTSNLALKEGLLKHKWLLVVTLDNVYMFESTINTSRQGKYNWLQFTAVQWDYQRPSMFPLYQLVLSLNDRFLQSLVLQTIDYYTSYQHRSL